MKNKLKAFTVLGCLEMRSQSRMPLGAIMLPTVRVSLCAAGRDGP